MMGVYSHARLRIPDAELDNELLLEFCETISSRLALRLGEEELPETFYLIGADAVVKMFRRMYYEGISSESMHAATQMSTAFVEDILNEYQSEIDAYIATRGGKVVFL